MKAKYRAIESRLSVIENVVDRCITEQGNHLPLIEARKIKAQVLRVAEGLLVLMTVEELTSDGAAPSLLRSTLVSEMENDVCMGIKTFDQQVSKMVQ